MGDSHTTRETAGFPRIYNIESDPKERTDVSVSGNAWVLGIYSKLIAQYKATLKDHPNPPAPNMGATNRLKSDYAVVTLALQFGASGN